MTEETENNKSDSHGIIYVPGRHIDDVGRIVNIVTGRTAQLTEILEIIAFKDNWIRGSYSITQLDETDTYALRRLSEGLGWTFVVAVKDEVANGQEGSGNSPA